MRRGRATGLVSLAAAAAASLLPLTTASLSLAGCGDDSAPAARREPPPAADSPPPGVSSVQQALLSGASVQQGTLTSTATGTQTVTIASVDPAKSFLLFSLRSNSADPDSSLIRGRIASATTLEFVRVSNDSAQIDLQWYVVSYPSGVTVQRGETTQSATTVNVTLPTAVGSLSRAFVTYSKTPAATDTSVDSTIPIVAELTTTSNLQFRANTAASAHVIWWQVVELASSSDINVQRGTTSISGSATSATVTLPTAVDPAHTFVLASYRTSGSGNDIGRRMIRAQLTNSTTITIDRSVGGAGDDISEVAWQAVELKDGSTVQRGTAAFASAAATATATLSAVDLTRTAAFSGVQGGGGQAFGRTAYTSSDVLGVASFTFALTSTQLTVTRSNTAGASDVGWYVVEFGNPPVCGNGVREGTEQCDGTVCCNGDCTYTAAGGAHAACTDLTPTDCQLAQCNGAGVCNQTQAAAGNGTACGDGVCNQCSAGICVDSPSGGSGPGCTASAAECSGADTCDGSGGCSANDLPSTTACGDTSPTDCHAARCDGSGACNQNAANVADGAGCGDGVCDQCSAGACVATASGSSGPGCTAGGSECSAADTCNGAGACSANDLAAGTACTDLAPTDCQLARCNGAGTCNQTYANVGDGAGCGDGVCDQCSAGSCVATASGSSGPGCTAAAGECSGADTCNGAGACNANDLAAGTACTDTSPTDCHVARCDGGGACNQSYTNVADGAGCGDGVCDQCSGGSCVATAGGGAGPGCNAGTTECSGADTCDGSGGCNTNDAASGATCTDTTPTDCHDARCNGSGTCNQNAANEPDGQSCPGGLCLSGACDPFRANGQPCASAPQCQSGICTDGYCCDSNCTQPCDSCANPLSLGTCSPTMDGIPGNPACDPYVCNGGSTSCPTFCIWDFDCSANAYCDNLTTLTCLFKKTDGQTCTAANQCLSGDCVDGVCCNTTCTGACEACNLPGNAGTCAVLAAGAAGAPSCAPYVCNGGMGACPAACTGDANCSAGNYCAGGSCVPKQSNGAVCSYDGQCASSKCVDGVCCNTLCTGACDACNLVGYEGTCTPRPDGTQGSPSCSPFLCDGEQAACPAACETSDDCVLTSMCDLGVCQPVTGLADGASCGSASECVSGFCVDGVCCASACSGQCDSCDLAGLEGTCSDEADGSLGEPSCSPNLCGGGADCRTTCASNADCASGFRCTKGVCGLSFALSKAWGEGQLLDAQNPAAKSLIYVETAGEARFHILAPSPDVDVVFYDPADNEITYRNAPSGMAYSRWIYADTALDNQPVFDTPESGPGYHVLLRVTAPAPGLWTVKTTATAPLTGPMAVQVSLETDGGPALGVVTDKDSYTTGETIKLFAHLRDTNAVPPSPITGAGVTASLLQYNQGTEQAMPNVPADAVRVVVTLRDDGGGGDVTPNDGVYTGTVALSTASSYMLDVEAMGTDGAGRTFQRAAGRDVVVQP